MLKLSSGLRIPTTQEMEVLVNPELRPQQRLDWVRSVTGEPDPRLVAASEDASFRSYWRLVDLPNTPIVMDAPPQREDIAPWLDVAERLRGVGLHVPAVHASDTSRGFALMEDLGERLYLAALDTRTAEWLYRDAMDALLIMQRDASTHDLPVYDQRRLRQELDLMPQWFVAQHLGITPQLGSRDTLEAAFHSLIEDALEQPQVFVHRDFHSRNLLVSDPHSPGIVDFQDAVRGPITYDLVSLLRDCYIAWPEEQVTDWVERYRQKAIAAGITHADQITFQRWFDWMGVQRHLKVLGVFSRLWYRDGKSRYLADLPRVWNYVITVASRYDELAGLAQQLERWIGDRDLSESRR